MEWRIAAVTYHAACSLPSKRGVARVAWGGFQEKLPGAKGGGGNSLLSHIHKLTKPINVTITLKGV